MNCAQCEGKECRSGKDCAGLAEELLSKYGETEVKLVHDAAAAIEKQFYMKLPRAGEVVEYVKTLGIKRIGIAFCIGLSEEARVAHEVFSRHCEVHSVCCKVCGIAKSRLAQPQMREGRRESICNPIGQAELLNRAQTQLNLTIGLCIGHDILFNRHSRADVSALVVKDRVLAHNPAGAFYSGYHRKLLLGR